MISISYFSAFPEYPPRREEGHQDRVPELLDQVRYSDDFIRRSKDSPCYPLINSAHAPFFDLIPATTDAELKALVMDKFKRVLEACGKLGIRNIVFHSGWLPKTYPEGEWVDNSLSFWTELLRSADSGTGIFIENVVRGYADRPVEVDPGDRSGQFQDLPGYRPRERELLPRPGRMDRRARSFDRSYPHPQQLRGTR
jgi:hypothetical protein